MIADTRGVIDRQVFGAQVAIVGSGPAGVALGLELAAAGVEVIVVESGGFGPSHAAQTLADGELVDPLHHAPLQHVLRRELGGASAIWGGRCVPLDPIDFEARAVVGHAEWPVTYDDVASFYGRACEWLQCGDPTFDSREIPALRARDLVPGFVGRDVLATTLERWSLPVHFGVHYRRQLRRSEVVTVVPGFTVVHLEMERDGSRIKALCARNPDGREIKIVADKIVLACGGLETTRLLLHPTTDHPNGVGNASGHLGRWYQTHLSGRVARVRFTGCPEATIYGHERDAAGVYVRRRLSFTPEALKREGLLNVVAWLANPPFSDASHGDPVLSFAYLILSSLLGPRLAPDAIRASLTAWSEAEPRRQDHLRNVFRGAGRVSRFAGSFVVQRYLRRRRAPGFFVRSDSNTYALHYHSEQVPDYESRVELAEERDAVGMRRLKVDLLFGQKDFQSVARAHELWNEHLRAAGVGELEFKRGDTRELVRVQASGGAHQIGTTRMSTSADSGVVDSNLRVHGVDNLYVASSSVFVTSGQANSTLPLIALTMRLADHLRGQAPAVNPRGTECLP